ncbi:MAG: serine--tRNA ligase, partial [Alphaproteobacteria bacterium]
MYDAKWIRENAAEFDRGLQRRGLPAMSPAFLELDKTRRDLVTVAQNIQTERNNLSKQIGIAKAKGEDAGPIMARVGELKDKQAQAEAAAAEADAKLTQFLETIPNLPADDVPEGADASANREVRAHGGKPNLGFAPKQHFELGEALGLMDFARAAKLSGARFTVLSGGLARLERALGQFMLDLHTRDFGYMEVNPPLLVRTNAVYGTGQLPKFADDLFRTETIDRDLIQRA